MRNYDMIADLYARLSPLTTSGAVTGVFDEQAPDNQAGPYLVIGYTREDEGRLVSDTERRGWVRVHIWSNMRGKSQSLQILADMDSALCNHESPFHHDDFECFIDPESSWVHGVATYRYYFERTDN